MDGATGGPLASRSEAVCEVPPTPRPQRRGFPRGAQPGCGAELGWDWLGAAPPGSRAFAPAPGEEL